MGTRKWWVRRDFVGVVGSDEPPILEVNFGELLTGCWRVGVDCYGRAHKRQ